MSEPLPFRARRRDDDRAGIGDMNVEDPFGDVRGSGGRGRDGRRGCALRRTTPSLR